MPRRIKNPNENGGSGLLLPPVVSFLRPSKPGVAGSNPAGRGSKSKKHRNTGVSENLVDSVNRSLRTDLPNAHWELTIEERLLGRGGLEARQRPNVVVAFHTNSLVHLPRSPSHAVALS